jgi:cytoskeletal protein RodZ
MFKKLSTLILAAAFFVSLPLWTMQAAYGQKGTEQGSTTTQEQGSSVKDPHAGHQHGDQKQDRKKADEKKPEDDGHGSHQHKDQKKQ